jgi:hypothetical protein
MRRLLILAAVTAAALASAAAAPAAEVALRTPGAESFSLRNGTGRAIISRRGAILGRIAAGRLVVVDVEPGGAPAVIVRGYESREAPDEQTTVYRGEAMSFRIFGGTWRSRIRGRGIYVSGVVRGWLTLVGTRGTFAIGDGPYRPWPSTVRTFRLAS